MFNMEWMSSVTSLNNLIVPHSDTKTTVYLLRDRI